MSSDFDEAVVFEKSHEPFDETRNEKQNTC